MEKTSVISIVEKCFEKEGNCIVFSLIDGSEVLINEKPSYFNLHLSANARNNYNGKTVCEVYNIPFSSILYITETNVRNLRIVQEEFLQITK